MDTDLIEGSGGVFEVRIDGALIYSKKETGTFPDEDAILAEVRRRK